jgi:hypothetical protein
MSKFCKLCDRKIRSNQINFQFKSAKQKTRIRTCCQTCAGEIYRVIVQNIAIERAQMTQEQLGDVAQ